ncbi:MAG: DUF131 domain-containing protein [Methanomassiliicoccales archaeon]|nr:DUF131 domain-containing protein [Methanomassiliicoccales archaeon]
MVPARLLRLAALLMIATGIVISIVSIAQGQMRVALFLIFPVFYAEGILPAIGIALLFMGMVALFLAFFASVANGRVRPDQDNRSFDGIGTGDEGKPKVKAGGVVLIGPVPIIFGSDWRMAVTAIILAILLVGMMLLFLL